MSAGVGADVVLHLLSSVVRNLIPVFAGWIVTSPALRPGMSGAP